MGYFSNGSEGEGYQAAVCSRCVHHPDSLAEHGCPIWDLHMLYNYAECNKPDSMLHVLIPRREKGLGNELCSMFIEKPADDDGESPISRGQEHGN